MKNEEHFLNSLLEIGNETIKEICNEMGTEVLYTSLHLDETTPHFHFQFKNFDNNGKSIEYKHRKKDFLSSLQDKVGDKFSKLGFKRGIKKDYTNRNHSKTIEHHTKKINELENELKDLRDTLKEEKKKVQKMDLSVEEKKKEYKKYDSYIKHLRGQIREVKQQKKDIDNIPNEIIKKTEEIIKNSKGTFGIDKDKLKNEIGQSLKEYSKYDIQSKELLELKKYKRESESDWNEIAPHIKKLKNKEKEFDKNKNLTNDLNNQLEQINQNYQTERNLRLEYQTKLKKSEEEVRELKYKYERTNQQNNNNNLYR